jgi:hypothetical protein
MSGRDRYFAIVSNPKFINLGFNGLLKTNFANIAIAKSFLPYRQIFRELERENFYFFWVLDFDADITYHLYACHTAEERVRLRFLLEPILFHTEFISFYKPDGFRTTLDPVVDKEIQGREVKWAMSKRVFEAIRPRPVYTK